MIKAIFTELNHEFGLPMIVGEKHFEHDDAEEAKNQAKTYTDVLSEVRGCKVSYMLEQNGGILVKLG